MKKYLGSKLLRGCLLAIIGLCLTASVVYGAVTTPANYDIISVEAYQSVISTNDQLYIVSIDLSDNTSITTPANEAWLVRMSDNGTIIGSVAPYAYYNGGYSQGVVSFYFSQDDADLPTWSTANISFELTGNPSLDWGGDPPKTTTFSVASYNVGNTLVPARIRVLATGLENDYNIDMIEAGGAGTNILTAYGEDYFETVIPNLRLIAPDVFSAVTGKPVVISHSYNQTYAKATEAKYSANETFGLEGLANMMGVSRMWVLSFLYILFSVGTSIVVCRNLESMRPMLFMTGALLTVGGAVGFAKFDLPIFVGILGVGIILFTFFWRDSP